jgi:hypothetical protein
MPQYCQDARISFLELLHRNPEALGLILLAIGLATPLIWQRLPGRWRYIALVLPIVPLSLMAAAGPVGLKWQMYQAERLLQSGTWRSAPDSYSLVLPQGYARAFRTTLGTDCSPGFIVETNGGYALDLAHASSPDEYAQNGGAIHQNPQYPICVTRLHILYGDQGLSERHKDCVSKKPTLEFFGPLPHEPGFEMVWCRRLPSEHYYCEANAVEVSLASGNKF